MLQILCIFLNLVIAIRAEIEGFIVGGEITSSEKNPHAAFLSMKCNHTHWNCGSSILNQDMVITAAHCVYRCKGDCHISVFVGHTERKRGIVRTVDDFIYHEKFTQFFNYGDIAVLKMSSPLQFSSIVRRVAIVKDPPYSEPARFAGWGLIDEISQTVGKDLKEVDQELWTRADCERTLDELPNGTFCASNKQGKGFGSRGDSGSGLVVRGYILIGLVSYKISALANEVVVYTDIGYFYEWIMKTVKKLCSKDSEALL